MSCNRCRRPVLEALADDCWPTRVDLRHLTPLEELGEAVAARTTFRLWPDGPISDLRRLAFRDLTHIRAHPGRGLAQHDCATPRQPDANLLASRRTSTPEDTCPF